MQRALHIKQKDLENGLHPITADRVDPEATKVVRRLVQHDYDAYLVGGCVRDLLVGRTPKDFDVSTSASPSEIRGLFRNSRVIGRRFRLVHIFFGRKIIETATFRAPPQRDTNGDDEEDEDLLIWRDNAFGTAEEDARRRDFTINGLFYDIGRAQVIDWVGGLEDLQRRSIRMIGDPQVRFQEDPVRILRAIKFATRLDFTIEASTEQAIVDHRGLIARCSTARVLEEIYRLLGSGKGRAAFEMMHRLGVLPVLFPEIAALLGPAADPRARSPVPAVNIGGRNKVEQTPSAEDVAAGSEKFLQQMELTAEEHQQEAVRQIWANLDALDTLVRGSRQTVHHPVLLGALLVGVAHRILGNDHRTGWTIERVDTLVKAVGTRIQISRRDKERLKQILIVQRPMIHGQPRRQMAQRDYFTEAYQLVELRRQSCSECDEAAQRWQEVLNKRGKRRRRRRGRNRNEQ